ncbi:MAG: hypothetical protein R3330_12425, partial [Saprospiraceae bacterium]|nr:hypothetical protein [Saprospiraceae bacterium]
MVTESSELDLNVQDQVICEGQTATLSVGSFDTYQWSTGAMTPTIDVTTTSTVSVTVTDVTGCTGTAEIDVTVNPEPFADVTSGATTCNATVDGSVIDFSALVTGGDTGGTWVDVDNSGATGPFTARDFDGVPEGQYTFTYTTNSAIAPCTDQEYTVTITVEDCACPSPQLSDPGPLCTDAGQLNLDDLLIPGVTEPGGVWSIISDPGGANPATLNGASFDATGADAGVYEVQYQLSGLPAGCPDSDSKLITVNLAPDAGVPGAPAQICAEEDTVVSLAGLVIDGQSGGMWIETSVVPSTGGAFNSGSATFTTVAQSPGTYTFEYIVMGVAPCNDASTTVEVVVEALPVADAGPDTQLTCDAPDAILGGTGSSTGPDFEYIWSTSGGVVTDTFSLNTQVGSAGTYILTVRNRVTGCESIDEVEITLAGDLPTDLQYTLDYPVCEGDPPSRFEIQAVSGGTGPYSYSLNGGPPSTETVYTDLPPGDYILAVTDVNGCPYQTSF